MAENPGRWFEIYVQDMERARTFYEKVLQLELTKLDTDHEIWAFPMAPDRAGSGGALVKIDGVPSGGNSVLIYFASDDCSVEAARVEGAGGKIFKGKTSIGPYGHIVLAVDTEGNMFGVHSMS